MSVNHSYSTYGAYELKASYQKNLILGNLFVFAIVVSIITTFWVISLFAEPIEKPIICDGWIITDPAPTLPRVPVFIDRAKIDGSSQRVEVRTGGIPNPVDDEEFLDEEDPIIKNVNEPAVGVSDGTTGEEPQFNPSGSYEIGDGDEEIYPGENEFVPHEKEPELYHYEQPIYPRLCRLAGIEGEVVLKVLVGKDGSVLKALVAKSSGNTSLDQAAIDASFDNQFTPALQNSIPISLWVSYTVKFSLQ